MSESELSALLQQNGWYLSIVRKWRKDYAYAKKREGKRVKSRYLKAVELLHELTPEVVLQRIQS